MEIKKKLTGKHVLIIMIVFFAIVIAANATIIYIAIKNFPGTVTTSKDNKLIE